MMLFKDESVTRIRDILSEAMRDDTSHERQDRRFKEIAEQLGRELEQYTRGSDDSCSSRPTDCGRPGRDEWAHSRGEDMRRDYASEDLQLPAVGDRVGTHSSYELRRQNPRHYQGRRGRSEGDRETRSMITRWALLGCGLGFTVARFWVGV